MVIMNTLIRDLIWIEPQLKMSVSSGPKWLVLNANFRYRQNEITIVMSLISMVVPNFFDIVSLLEGYHPRKAMRWMLARIMALNLLRFVLTKITLKDYEKNFLTLIILQILKKLKKWTFFQFIYLDFCLVLEDWGNDRGFEEDGRYEKWRCKFRFGHSDSSNTTSKRLLSSTNPMPTVVQIKFAASSYLKFVLWCSVFGQLWTTYKEERGTFKWDPSNSDWIVHRYGWWGAFHESQPIWSFCANTLRKLDEIV